MGKGIPFLMNPGFSTQLVPILTKALLVTGWQKGVHFPRTASSPNIFVLLSIAETILSQLLNSWYIYHVPSCRE